MLKLIQLVLFIFSLASPLTFAISFSESPSPDGNFEIYSTQKPVKYIPQQTTSIYQSTFLNTYKRSHLYTGVDVTNGSGFLGTLKVEGANPGRYSYELGLKRVNTRNGSSFDVPSERGFIEVLRNEYGLQNTNIDLKNYEIFYGDFNADGTDGDIYLHPKSNLILIGTDVLTPILIGGKNGFVYYRQSSSELFGYHYAEPLLFKKNELSKFKKALPNTDYFLEDLSVRGSKNDFFIRGFDAGYPSLMLMAQSTGLPKGSVPQFDIYTYFDPSDRQNYLSFEDRNLDGIADLLLMSGRDGVVYQVMYSDARGIVSDTSYKTRKLSDIFNVPVRKANTIGFSEGQFNVSEVGAATYTMPIHTPSGSAGVKPSIALNYSSNGSVGLLGLGWSLSANNAIGLCRKTMASHNVNKPLSWSEPVFCMNGRQLLLISGQYGKSGSKYKSEIDDFTEITLHGESQSNTSYFSSLSKDGTLTYYGLTTGLGVNSKSKQDFGSGRIMTWAQSHTYDIAGNAIRYFYDHTNGKDFRINKVDYAYDTNNKARASIRFNYDKRPDTTGGFVAGVMLSQSYRLSSITVHNNISRVEELRKYSIFYALNTNDKMQKQYSLVRFIQECAQSSCKTATQFDWELKTSAPLMHSGTPDQEYKLNSKNPINDQIFIDINGDGMQDIAYVTSVNDGPIWDEDVDTRLHYALATDSGYVKRNFVGSKPEPVLKFAEGRKNKPILRAIDYNADGKTDIAVYRWRPNGAVAQWKIYLSVPTGDTNHKWGISRDGIETNITDDKAEFLDFDGDGLVDILTKDKVYYLKPKSTRPTDKLYKSNNFYHFVEQNLTRLNLDSSNQRGTSIQHYYHGLGDYNGDGRMDIIIKTKKTTVSGHNNGASEQKSETFYVFTNEKNSQIKKLIKIGSKSKVGTRSVRVPINSKYSDDAIDDVRFEDINGDGLSDIVFTQDKNIYFMQSNGITFLPKKSVAAFNNDTTISQFVDFNYDGALDLVISGESGKTFKVYKWDKEKNIFDKNIILARRNSNERHNHQIVDINGDGLLDYIAFQGSDLKAWFRKPLSGKHDVIKKITTGKNFTEITYGNLSTSKNYTPLSVNLTESDRGEYCRSRNKGRFSVKYCEEYVLYSADDYYYTLNYHLNVGEYNKTRNTTPVMQLSGNYRIVTSVESLAPSSIESSNFTEGDRNVNTKSKARISYYYEDARVQSGRGFLGFGRLSTVDEQTGILQATSYNQLYPLTGLPKSTMVYSPDGSSLFKESFNSYIVKQSNREYQFSVDTYFPAKPIHVYADQKKEIHYSTAKFGSAPLFFNSESGNQVILKETVSNFIEDQYGNTLESTVSIKSDKLQKTVKTLNVYGNGERLTLHTNTPTPKNTDYKIMGRLTKSTVSHTRNNVSSDQIATFSYYASDTNEGYAGMLKTEKLYKRNGYASSDIDLSTLKTYMYDRFGNVTKTSQRGWDGEKNVNRVARQVYDSSGRFVKESYDALNNKYSFVKARSAYGTPTQVEGLNGVNTTTQVDEWGRTTRESTNTGNWISYKYLFCSKSPIPCPSDGYTILLEYTNQAGNAHPQTVTVQDAVGRVIREGKLGFNGLIYVDSEYDILGRVVRTSNPFNEFNKPDLWTKTELDILGRPVKLIQPNGAVSLLSYNGYTKSTRNAKNQLKTEIENSLGETIEVVDSNRTKVVFDYNHFGELVSSKILPKSTNIGAYSYGDIKGLCRQPTSNLETIICYDAYGRKQKMWDPTKGLWSYQYNAFGEMVSQTNANGQMSTIKYDLLGRTINRTDYTQHKTIEGHTTWYYDNINDAGESVSNARLKATSVVYTQGAKTNKYNGTNYTVRTEYDQYGQPSIVTSLMPDGSVYKQQTIYDYSNGRVAEQRDVLNGLLVQSGNTINSGIKNHYNSFGIVDKVTDLVDGKTLYELKEQNDRGQTTKAKIGGLIDINNRYDEAIGNLKSREARVNHNPVQDLNYSWDEINNLTKREAFVSGTGPSYHILESFCYDRLNRLTTTYRAEDEDHQLGVNCNSLEQNRILTHIKFDDLGNIIYKSDVGEYKYDLNSQNNKKVSPYTLTRTIEKNRTVHYEYDANGNLLKDNDRQFKYATFDKPVKITRGQHTVEFKYGPSRNRYYRKDTNPRGTKHIWYLGNVEKHIKPNGEIEWRRQLPGGGYHTYYTNKQHTIIKSPAKRFILKDHLGSPSVILNQYGQVEKNMAFDAWGHRRQTKSFDIIDLSAPTNGAYSSYQITELDIIQAITNEGYTGHEMLDEVGIVHMNGRIYDPRLGRFLQADPFIDGATNTQGHNRYSYIQNNPLNATDPSGHFVQILIAAVAYYAKWQITTTIIVSSIAAGIQTLAAGGSLNDAFRSAVITGATAVAFNQIGQHFAKLGGEGTAQAAAAAAGGTTEAGKALFEFGGNYLTKGQVGQQIVAHGLVGGITSSLQGGKFGHGFFSAGFTKAIMAGAGFNYGNQKAHHVLGRTAVAALVGGTTSKVSGGKFANGAKTAALAHLLNQESGAFAQKSKVNFIYETDGLDKFKAAAEKYAEHYEGILPPGEHDVHVYLENFKSGDHMMQAPNGVTIWVAPDYADHPLNIVGTAIGHELVHLRDHLDPSMNMRSSFTRNSSELNAYQWNLDNAKEFNLPLQYKSYFRQKKQQYY